MTDDMIAYAIETMKANGILESGDAVNCGIGAMTNARWESDRQSADVARPSPPKRGLQEGLHPRIRRRKGVAVNVRAWKRS
jgi:hypothetical protein